MKPHQYFFMIAAITFGYFALNFLIAYLESQYKVVRIEDSDEQKNIYVEWDDKVFNGDATLPTDTFHTFIVTEPVQRQPITGYRQMQDVKSGYHNIAIGHESGWGKNENVGY
jgi:hypothetical protein